MSGWCHLGVVSCCNGGAHGGALGHTKIEHDSIDLAIGSNWQQLIAFLVLMLFIRYSEHLRTSCCRVCRVTVNQLLEPCGGSDS